MSIDDSQLGSVSRRKDRIAGCLVGLAVGDALGAPLEFQSRRQVREKYPEGLRDMIDSNLWKKGEYTDDTEMALLIADSLLQSKGFIASDLAQRFKTWARTAKDVGIQTRAVVNMAGYVRDPEGCSSQYREAHPDSSAGNGALMRCAPIALFCLDSVERLVELSRASARVTHFDPKAQSSCVILNTWIQAATSRGIRDARAESIGLLNETECSAWHRLEEIEVYKEDDIKSSGYTVDTLEAAVWSFLTTASYEEAVVRAVNLGDDADTVGAVCGSLAGAYYGYAAIPKRWRNQLREEARIHKTALALGGFANETHGKLD
ncbi:MAG TPA: ADP-ribosylglycohydrolase family protein [Terriglobales bacterium]|nr:ADP-ribosylglycohydrolase family protein [Terriglobales bacterium]